MAEERAANGEDLRAALEARRELGPEHEQEVVDAFLDRIERSVAQRVASARTPARRDHRGSEQRRFVLVIVSLAAGVPLTAIALASSGLAALVVVWIGIVLVNVAYARAGG